MLLIDKLKRLVNKNDLNREYYQKNIRINISQPNEKKIPEISIVNGARPLLHRGDELPEAIIETDCAIQLPDIMNKSLYRGQIDSTIYVITPAFNSARFIDSTILNVVTQEGAFSIRYHVQDGGSSDSTLSKLKRWKALLTDHTNPLIRCKDVTFSYDSEPDNGMYDAIHKALTMLKIPGRAITTWINSDDTFNPGAFATAYNIFNSGDDVCWILCSINGSGLHNEELSYIPLQFPIEIIRSGLCDGIHWNFIQQEGSFFLRSLYNRSGGLNTDLRFAGDWDLWRKFGQFSEPVHALWSLARFRKHTGQLTSEIKSYYKEIEKIVSLSERKETFQNLKKSAIATMRVVERPQGMSSLKINRIQLQQKYCHPNSEQVHKFQQQAIKNIEQKIKLERESPLKVLTLCTLDFGGAGTGSQRRIAALRNYGLDVTMASLIKRSLFDYVYRLEPTLDGIDSSIQDNVWKVIVKSAVNKVMMNPAYNHYEMFSIPESCLDWRQLQSLFNSFDVIHLHWVVGMLDLEHMHAVLKEKPVIWTLADFNAFSGGCHYPGGCENFKKQCKNCPQLVGSEIPHKVWKMKKNAYEKLNIHFVCPSAWMAKQAKKSSLIGKRPIHIINNAYPVDLFKPLNKANVRKKLGLPAEKKLLLFGADSVLNKRKGFDLLQEAIQYYIGNQKQNNIEAVIFGKGNINIPIKTHSFGHISEDKLPLLYSAADLFISPSREDVGPMTVAESMLCGTPVVAYPVGIMSEIVKHKVNGYIAKAFSIEDLANGIKWTLSELESNIGLSKQCIQSALNHCNPLVSANKHIALYKKAIKELKSIPFKLSIEDTVANVRRKDNDKNRYLSDFRSNDISVNKIDNNTIFVITPCLNAEKTIDETIQSVINQEGDFIIRYHIQDGGSNDGTIGRIKRWESLLLQKKTDIRCRQIILSWFSETDKGIYDAIMKGFDHLIISPDDFMTWINGDDLLMPGAFKSIIRISTDLPKIQWIGSLPSIINENGRLKPSKNSISIPTRIIREGLCDGRDFNFRHLQQEGMFFKKRLWFKAKHVLKNFKYAGDWALWKEMAHHSDYYQYESPLGAFRKRDGQISVVKRGEYNAEINSASPFYKRKEMFNSLKKRNNLYARMIINKKDGKMIESKKLFLMN